MATVVAASYDDEGNFFSVTPFAGCSLDSIISHPDWFEAVSAQDRLELIRLVLVQMMGVFDIMQKTVSATGAHVCHASAAHQHGAPELSE